MKKRPTQKKAPFSLIFSEIILGSLLASLAFLTFAELSHRVLAAETIAFDQTLMTTIHSFRSPIMTEIMLFISFLGGNFLFIPGVLIFLYLLKKRYRHEALLFSVAVLTGVVLNLVLKTLVARARPDIAPLITEVFYSYPSGHSMNAFVFYSLLAFLSFHFTRNGRISGGLTLLCSVLILLIGISRVYLGVHYPSDVIAGYLVGLGWVLTVLVIDKTVTHFQRRRIN